nr:hypothetical protein [Erysipelothrix urinaevulpis]
MIHYSTEIKKKIVTAISKMVVQLRVFQANMVCLPNQLITGFVITAKNAKQSLKQ